MENRQLLQLGMIQSTYKIIKMKNIEKTGIWVDFDKAYIIELKNQQESIKKINSNIEHFNVHGGARSKTANGPQDTVSESKILERNQHQQKEFFTHLINTINPKSEVVIFGPAEAKINLKKELLAHSAFRNKAIPVETSDSMTENQMIAWLKKYTN